MERKRIVICTHDSFFIILRSALPVQGEKCRREECSVLERSKQVHHFIFFSSVASELHRSETPRNGLIRSTPPIKKGETESSDTEWELKKTQKRTIKFPQNNRESSLKSQKGLFFDWQSLWIGLFWMNIRCLWPITSFCSRKINDFIHLLIFKRISFNFVWFHMFAAFVFSPILAPFVWIRVLAGHNNIAAHEPAAHNTTLRDIDSLYIFLLLLFIPFW